jgi:hypothetical protein
LRRIFDSSLLFAFFAHKVDRSGSASGECESVMLFICRVYVYPGASGLTPCDNQVEKSFQPRVCREDFIAAWANTRNEEVNIACVCCSAGLSSVQELQTRGEQRVVPGIGWVYLPCVPPSSSRIWINSPRWGRIGLDSG